MLAYAFFHLPKELKTEVEEGGFHLEKIVPIEGPCWLLENFDEWWNDPVRRERILKTIQLLENESFILSVSSHLLAIAGKLS